MKYKAIANTGIEVSEISFGCWTMGGKNWVNGGANGWADPDEDDITKAIKLGLDAGVNHFDNADVYGNGKAERMLARVLKRLGIKDSEVVVATKVGHFPGTAEHAYEPAHIRHQCEQSLVNLKRDYIDIYYFHHGSFGENQKYLDGAVEVMDDLVKQGKARARGFSAYTEEHFLTLTPKIRPDVLQSWAHALDDQFVKPESPVQKMMAERGIGMVCFSPLAKGVLLAKHDPKNPPEFEPGDHRRDSGEFTKERLLKLQPGLEKLKAKFGTTTEELAAVALNYVLAQPGALCVIPGFRNERQAKCNVAAAERAPLTPGEVAFVREALQGGAK